MYLDTSVLVKLYVREPDSQAVEQIVSGERLLCSELVYAEFWSALLAKERAGVLTPDMRQRVWHVFEHHLLDDLVELVELDGIVVREAAEMMARVFPRVPLRTLDALHLATFAAVDAGPLFTKDQRMMDAARLLGLPLVEGA